MIQRERQLQINLVAWFRLAYNGAIIHHSPNGGKRNLLEAVKFKAMGTLAGFPDLFIAEPKGGFHGCFIELKDGKKGRLSENQNIMLDELAKRGYFCAIVRDYEQGVNIINSYMQQ